jgi:hypothetical protein
VRVRTKCVVLGANCDYETVIRDVENAGGRSGIGSMHSVSWADWSIGDLEEGIVSIRMTSW